VFEAGVGCAGVYEVCEAHLPYMAEALDWWGVYQGEVEAGEFYVLMDGVFYCVHGIMCYYVGNIYILLMRTIQVKTFYYTIWRVIL